MKSFKEYAKTAPESVPKEAASAEELTKKIAAAYSGKSNMEVMRSILSEAEKSKRAGTLSNEEIDGFFQTFSPMLEGGQRRQLKAIVDRLKEI